MFSWFDRAWKWITTDKELEIIKRSHYFWRRDAEQYLKEREVFKEKLNQSEKDLENQIVTSKFWYDCAQYRLKIVNEVYESRSKIRAELDQKTGELECAIDRIVFLEEELAKVKPVSKAKIIRNVNFNRKG